MLKHKIINDVECRRCSKCKKWLPATNDYFRSQASNSDGFNSQCKECVNGKPIILKANPKEGFKICSKCGKELASTNEYFFKDGHTKDRLKTSCKECNGGNYTPYVEIPKGFKKCNDCGKILPCTNEYFMKSKRSIDGFKNKCKECTSLYKKQMWSRYKENASKHSAEYRRNNSEKLKEKSKIYREKNKEKISNTKKIHYQKNKYKLRAYSHLVYINNKESAKAYNKAYYISNSNKIKASTKEYSNTHKDKCRENSRLYYIANKEILRIKQKEYMKHYSATEHGKLVKVLSSQRRRARKRKAISTLTNQDWKECLKYFDYKDAYTGLPLDKPTQDHVIPLNKGGAYVKRNIVPCSLETNGGKCDNDMEVWYKKQSFFSEKRLQKIYKWMGVNKGIQQLKMI